MTEKYLDKNKNFILYPIIANSVFIHDSKLMEKIEPELNEFVDSIIKQLNGAKKNNYFVENGKKPEFNYIKNLYGKEYTLSDLEKKLNSNGFKNNGKINILSEEKGERHGIIKMKNSYNEIKLGCYVIRE